MMLTYFDLTLCEHSYLFGFLQGDGHLYRNRTRVNKGSLSVELSAGDKPLLEKFQAMIPFYSSVTMRSRDTNFKTAYKTVVWSVSDQQFRAELFALGLPAGRKSADIQPPSVPFLRSDYYRGLIDADGSLGLEKSGLPFLSLTTSSCAIADDYQDFLFEITGKRKQQGRNRRDNVYNILVFKEDAQSVVSRLYYPGCLALQRKEIRAQEVKAWVRPLHMKLVLNRREWTSEEDVFLLTHSLQDSVAALGRTINSVSVRRVRLRRALKAKQ